MEFVLNYFEKLQGFFRLWVIVNSQLINILDFLIKTFLAGTDVADTLKDFIKLIRANIYALLKAFIIHREALD